MHRTTSVAGCTLDWVSFGSLVEEVKKKEETPVRKIINVMDNNVGDVFPMIYVLTSYDTTSKNGTKSNACEVVVKYGCNLLYSSEL